MWPQDQQCQDHLRNANSWAPLQTCSARTLGQGPAQHSAFQKVFQRLLMPESHGSEQIGNLLQCRPTEAKSSPHPRTRGPSHQHSDVRLPRGTRDTPSLHCLFPSLLFSSHTSLGHPPKARSRPPPLSPLATLSLLPSLFPASFFNRGP